MTKLIINQNNNLENYIATDIDEQHLKIVKEYKTVEEMKQDATLTIGDVCHTLGYYTINDGGDAKYVIDNTSMFPFENLSDSLFANQILTNNKLNVLSIGIRYFNNNKKYKDDNSKLVLDILTNNTWRRPFILYFPFIRNNSNTQTIYYMGNIDIDSLNGSNKMLNIELQGEDSINLNEYVQINTEGDNLFYLTSNTFTYGVKYTAKNLSFVSKNLTDYPTGICFGTSDTVTLNETNFYLDNVSISGFEYGVRSGYYSCGGSGGRLATFSFCKYGIYIKSTAHLFNSYKFSFNNCAMGIRIPYGNNAVLTDTHIALGLYNQQLSDEIEKPYGIHCKGNLIINGIYYEDYGSSVKDFYKKFAIIDFEGAAVTSPVLVKNTSIGKPSGAGGYFLRASTYLGHAYEDGITNPLKVNAYNKLYYPNGAMIFNNCSLPKDSFKSLLVDENNNFKINWLGYSFNDKEIYNNDIITNNANCCVFTKINSKITNTVTNFEMNSIKIDDSTTFFSPNFSYAKTKTVNGIKVSLDSHILVDLSGYYLVNILGALKLNEGITPNLNITIGLLAKKFASSEIVSYPITTFITNGKNQIIPINFNYYIFIPFQLLFGFININTETFFNKNDKELINYNLTFKVYFEQSATNSNNVTADSISN
ncbi:hypothetical protein [uncultured Clostridium sp.]|uniref:hypothetical protein n=1 Tax=uncultured Clostridium sp. TaxID=59620 RepID=UPI002596EDF3|nr:hypothetical protein [uncultured Clostridium sp.]